MDYIIRPEKKEDYKGIHEVVKSAFYRENKPYSFNEWKLIDDVRNSKDFIEELSLVATYQDKVVGHILFTPINIISDSNIYESLALAPIAVAPQYQNKGIGHELIYKGIKKVKELGYGSIFVLGHPSFYTKFGFKLASKWKIGIDDNFESEYLFGLELIEGELSKVKGNIRYCDSFYNDKGELI